MAQRSPDYFEWSTDADKLRRNERPPSEPPEEPFAEAAARFRAALMIAAAAMADKKRHQKKPR